MNRFDLTDLIDAGLPLASTDLVHALLRVRERYQVVVVDAPRADLVHVSDLLDRFTPDEVVDVCERLSAILSLTSNAHGLIAVRHAEGITVAALPPLDDEPADLN